MLIVKGNKQLELSKDAFLEIRNTFKDIEIDIGTGDGRYIYKNALNDEGSLYVGVDPSAKQLEEYSKKANRKKLKNILFVVGSVENYPNELKIEINKLTVNFPWGTLLQATILATKDLITVMRTAREITIVFGYRQENEPSETARLGLPVINHDYLVSTLIPKYEKENFILKELNLLENTELSSYETSWSKKLGYGMPRDIYKVTFQNRILLNND